MQEITNLYHVLQTHPLYYQLPLGLIAASGLFDYLKHKLELEGKAKITAYLTLISTATVLIHGAIAGLAFAGPIGFLKITAQQTAIFIGGLTLVYNFLTIQVTNFLKDAQARAAVIKASQPTTPAQKTQTSAQASPEAAAGVAQF